MSSLARPQKSLTHKEHPLRNNSCLQLHQQVGPYLRCYVADSSEISHWHACMCGLKTPLIFFIFGLLPCRNQSLSRTLRTMWPLWRTSTPPKSSIRFRRTKPCWKTSTKPFKASKCKLETSLPSQQVQAACQICIHHGWTPLVWRSNLFYSGAYSKWPSLQKDDIH